MGTTNACDAANHTYIDIDNVSVIPEPGVFALALVGLVLILRFRRK